MTIDQFIIYNPNSKGGNHKYALHTAQALSEFNKQVTLILPQNASVPQQPSTTNSTSQNSNTTVAPLYPKPYALNPILISDQPSTNNTILKKIHFFLRILLNPIIFFFYLRQQSSSNIIFNDFDQLTAIIWAPLFKLLKKKHQFSVILHDPDRDAYPGGIKHTNRSMKAMMRLMDIAFFHEQLPQKAYYNSFNGKKISIPHGLYEPALADKPLLDKIVDFKGDAPLLCIPGNIRMEKNYELIIESLKDLPQCKLLIAGAPSSSVIKVNDLIALSQKHSLADRIYWHTDYLTDEEFTSILEVSDLILLYYKNSFTSASGVLNQIAPLKKNVLISDTPSALTKLAKEFNLGTISPADSKEAFIQGVEIALSNTNYIQHWNKYLDYACWNKQSNLIIEGFSHKTLVNS